MTVGDVEKATQNRIINLFKDELKYNYLGNWGDREGNSNIEREFLLKFLKGKYDDAIINRAIAELEKAATNQSKIAYDVNKDVYSMLRYGVQVKENIGENKQTVWLINWKEPLKNDFYIAEEVTIKGQHEKRPDIVLYINGIAIAVLGAQEKHNRCL